jgi:hypothetical protein
MALGNPQKTEGFEGKSHREKSGGFSSTPYFDSQRVALIFGKMVVSS